ncbi:MAG: 2-C-methyl-D-erythritol 4-phosphate cytidylyltransferase [Planctomycetota bacterium]
MACVTQKLSYKKAVALVVAAGSSSRIGGKVRKPYLKLRGKSILTWALIALSKVRGLKQIVLVTRPEDRAEALVAVADAKLPKNLALNMADGGLRRQDSVFNGLKATASDADVVMIHDAARPFPPQQPMEQACHEAYTSGAAILAVRVKDTVKRQNDHESSVEDAAILVEATVPRVGLWLAQTPQVFRRELIMTLFERLARESPDQEVTDDASVCEFFKQPVALIPSNYTNLKVTRPEDLPIAEAYLRNKLHF